MTEKKGRVTSLEFLKIVVLSRIVVKNSPLLPLIRRFFRFEGGAVLVDLYCIHKK